MLDDYLDLVWKYFPYARRNASMTYGSFAFATGFPLLLVSLIFIYSVGKIDDRGNLILPNNPVVQVVSAIGAPFALGGLAATHVGVMLYSLGFLCKADKEE